MVKIVILVMCDQPIPSEFIRSLIEDQNDMTFDGLSREITYFMDNHSIE